MTEVQEKIKVFAVCGPTASGKTSLSGTHWLITIK